MRPPGSAVVVDLTGAKEFGGGSGGKGLAPSIAHFSVATIRENRTEAIEQSPRWSKKIMRQGFSPASRRLHRVVLRFAAVRSRKSCNFLPLEILLPLPAPAAMSLTHLANQNYFSVLRVSPVVAGRS